MRTFHWMGFLLTGFVMGLIGPAVLPGSDKMGLTATTLVGILGLAAWRIPRRVDFKAKRRSEIPSRRFPHVDLGAVVLLVILRLV